MGWHGLWGWGLSTNPQYSKGYEDFWQWVYDLTPKKWNIMKYNICKYAKRMPLYMCFNYPPADFPTTTQPGARSLFVFTSGKLYHHQNWELPDLENNHHYCLIHVWQISGIISASLNYIQTFGSSIELILNWIEISRYWRSIKTRQPEKIL